MKKQSKVLLVMLCAVLLITGAVLGTLAYLTDKDNTVNTFTVGKVDIILDETDADDSTEGADRDNGNAYHLLPGHSYIKDPTVHVVKGSSDCYVRMLLTINKSSEWDAICSQYKKEDAQGNKTDENLFGIVDILTGYDPATWIYMGNTENSDNTRTYEFWYKEKVTGISQDQDKDLQALFTAIEMPGELTNADMEKLGDDFKINVVAHAIQADGFDTAADAWAKF